MNISINNLDVIKEDIRRIALINAILHGGKAQNKPVISKLLNEKPELKNIVREIVNLVNKIVYEVNGIPLEEQIQIVKKKWPEALEKQAGRDEYKEKILPPLPNVEKYSLVVTRFAPNPDCVLHLGSARAIILSHEYARIYGGRFILRFEDTDPRLKRSSLDFMDLIRKDLEWLGCQPDEEYIQSDRIEIYYEHAENLIKGGYAYVCTCHPEEFRKRILAKEPCPCRSLKPEDNLRRWEDMLSWRYAEGKAVMRIKTDLNHPNPAVRDWPAFRIIDTKRNPHPRVGSKYCVWPLYNFACGVDDHLMSVTHIIRGKEHITNQERQKYMYYYFGWKYPEAIHYGRLKIEGTSLSKSKILHGVKEGIYEGWDDPRLATFLSLRRRGIKPEAIRKLILEIGPRAADITISWENLYAHNRKIVDSIANRYFFVWDPVKLTVKNVIKNFVVEVPLHPSYPNRGKRVFHVKPANNEVSLLISGRDADILKPGAIIRLMELFNVEIEAIDKNHVSSLFHSEAYSEAKKLKARLIHWIPEGSGVSCEVIMPDNSRIRGLAEDSLKNVSSDEIIQFERFGFVRIEKTGKEFIAVFAHK